VTHAGTSHADAIVAAMHNGRYERNEQDFMRLVVRSGSHVVDVGAHIGFHTRLLVGLVGSDGFVTAFEPLAEHVAELAREIPNELRRRVRIVPAAVADVSGTRTMVAAASDMAPANACFCDVGPLVSDVHAVMRQVPVVTLDEEVGRPPVGFLKIDAEGAEALVLRGARRVLIDHHPVVLADLHPHLMKYLDRTTPEALIREMAEIGYECRLLGAGVAGSRIADVHAPGVTTVVFQ
jgi:FkbM family methyltransferase